MSQSPATSGGATTGHPLVMKGSFFSTKLYDHHQGIELNMSEHFLGSNKGFNIFKNLGLDPLVKVVITEGEIEIKSGAFKNCIKLEEVILPKLKPQKNKCLWTVWLLKQ